mmetsp:Transcript_32933/g.53278  ORF Transcript_32933/g.53278 Transcript_32933/m.53278 type:complete len:363 (+) Transcript_32933:164-1252(+)
MMIPLVRWGRQLGGRRLSKVSTAIISVGTFISMHLILLKSPRWKHLGDKEWSSHFFRAPKRTGTGRNENFSWENLKEFAPNERSYYIGNSVHAAPGWAGDVNWYQNKTKLTDFMQASKEDLDRERKLEQLKDEQRLSIALGVNARIAFSEPNNNNDVNEEARSQTNGHVGKRRKKKNHENNSEKARKRKKSSRVSKRRYEKSSSRRTHKRSSGSESDSQSCARSSSSDSSKSKRQRRHHRKHRRRQGRSDKVRNHDVKLTAQREVAKAAAQAVLNSEPPEKKEKQLMVRESLVRSLGESYGWDSYLAEKYEYAGSFVNQQQDASKKEKVDPLVGLDENWTRVPSNLAPGEEWNFGADRLGGG